MHKMKDKVQDIFNVINNPANEKVNLVVDES